MFVATIGDEVTVVATTLTLALETSSVAGVSSLMIAVTVPSIVLAPWIGRFVDKHPTRVSITASVAAAGVVVLVLGAVEPFWMVIALVGTLGVAAAVVSTALIAAVPRLVEGTRWSIARANAALEVIRSSSFLVAPPLAALLISTLSYRVALACMSAAYIAAAVMFMLSLRSPNTHAHGEATADDGAEQETPHLLVGFKTLFSQPEVLVPLAAVVLAVAGSAVFDVLLVFFVVEDLNLGAAGYGTLLTMWSIGLLVGPFVTRALPQGDRVADSTMLAVAFAIVHVASFGIAAALATPWFTYMAFIVGGAGNALQNIYMRSAVLVASPRPVVGSVAAAYLAVLQTGSVAGLMVAGFLPATGARAGLITASTFSAVSALLALGYVLRNRQKAHVDA
ncbi:hypothetical protein ASG84_25745 [Rhodococcus sp. Leaf278]|uniref:MFS transporter n=1 Tax=Rhodococcus sp. Leaf278 TaxID=1736319 RepID=UPI00070D40C4|nr:MFS transporter [Rhodococcus sp. Leaf278]KQU51504.1 hypothetical protein ASG84_25745 [Rhodococcus sp. Leaf278]